MKFALTAVLIAAATIPAAAQAQTAPAPAPAPAPEAGAATAPAGRFTLDTPVEQIVADKDAKAVLDADLPGVTEHPSYDQFKSMSLRELQPYSQGAITDDIMKKIEADLAALG